jgi:hypothetical protein
MATGDAFTDEEIDDILDRMLKKAQRKGQAFDKAGIQEAAAELTKEEVFARLSERRLRVAAERARGRIDAQMAGMAAIGDEADRLKAYNVGSEKQGLGGSFSVDAEARARTTALWGEAERQLRDAGLLNKLSGFAVDGTLERNIRRERARLNGAAVEPTGDADALKTAEILNALSEKGRLMQNDVGAWIGRLEGYAGRQTHDRLRVSGGFWREFQAGGLGAIKDMKGAGLKASRRAFREWRDFIRPKLDDRTFDGIEARDVDEGWIDDAKALQTAGAIDDAADVREVFLYRVWFDIVSGRSEVLGGLDDIGDFRPPASKARSVSKHRVLHFKTPDDAHDYALRFGRGSLLANAMAELERAARNTALMNRWGPAPEAMFDNTVARLHAQARARGDAGAANRLMRAQRRAEFDELTGAGNQPDSLRLAMIGRSIRLQQSLAKLGGMVLSGLSDTSLAATAMKRAGATWLDGYTGALTGVARMQGTEGKAAADLLDVGARSAAAHLTGRFHAADGPLGWAAQAQRFFYRVNLFEFWQDGLRRGVAEMYSAHLGAEAAKPWDGLNAGTRETLERYGIEAADWELIRRGLVEPEAPAEGFGGMRARREAGLGEADTAEPEGRRYFTFEALDGISDRDLHRRAGLSGKEATPEAARRLREDLRIRVQAMVGGVLDDALTEARARERVALTRGVRPGTVWGESVRAFTQFWSFSAAIMGRHVAPAAAGYAGQAPVALLAHLILASTALGYLSLQAKQLAKGRELRPMTNEDGEFQGGELFLASLLQGGGLGIYGDFLFGEASRNGLPATLSAFAGPAVGEAEKLRGILADLISGDPERIEDVPAAGFRFAKDNTPFLNLFYARTALDYLILYRIQEAISPGSVERYERRVEEQTGAGFIVSPSEAIGA